MVMLDAVLQLLQVLPCDPPTDPPAMAPPGSGGILTILSWVKWLCFAVAIAGVLIVGGRMAISHRRGGDGGEHATALAWVLAGVIVISSGVGIIMALVGA
ncbi:hypothetical protein [Propionicicella superfundia]|uniref:hypothetical protein n=1 Tax=Propionicicella superfundia TaxID=348582 RepID=UPI00041C6571|nr:hypothetical protein [Propionicicella superfundia]